MVITIVMVVATAVAGNGCGGSDGYGTGGCYHVATAARLQISYLH